MKITHKRAVFLKNTFNILINFVFIFLLFTVVVLIYNVILFFVYKIPNLNNYVGNFITIFVTIMLAIISYATRIKIFLKKLLFKIKQKIYIFLSLRYNWFFSKSIDNYNIYKFYGTTEQLDIINSAINILKNNKQNIFLISGFPGKGKTTTIMLLLDVIAHDGELYDMFIELQHHIVYFDSVKDFDKLMYCLRHPEKQRDKIVIIDNFQKFSTIVLSKIFKRINNMIVHFQEEEKKVLFILSYQKIESNLATYDHIKNTFFNSNQNIFTLNEKFSFEKKDLTRKNFKFQQFKDKIDNLDDEGLLKNHLERIYINSKDRKFIKFLDQLLFYPHNQTYNIKKARTLYVFTSIINISYYYGYVTKKNLVSLWKNKYVFSLGLIFIIHNFIRNSFLVPFPLIHTAYIFNEQLAREYKKILVNNNLFLTNNYYIAERMFDNCEENMKWLFFISCSPEFCSQYPQNKRIQYFEKTLNTYHLQYILDIVECEMSIVPEKEGIFRQERGILYLYNGEWKKSKNILYPYIEENDINKDIWHIQLKIIEAEHGCCDEDNLEMLDCMKSECSDPKILFQINYWREHIFMEHGKFSLNEWKKLLDELRTSDQLLQLNNDEHFSTRIISDLERTYFLKGNVNYSDYMFILKQYSFFNKKDGDSIELILSRAYYIQYDVLFQLGIWGCIEYPDIEPNIIGEPILMDCNNTIENLVIDAINIYDTCINKYKSAGKKKYRTLQVRRAELTLCIDSNQYISVLNKYNEFELYARQNNISVFEGYCNTQKGKAFTLYAASEFQKGNLDKSTEFLAKAEDYLMEAKEIYEKFGNDYGVLRAEFLSILVNMIRNRNNINKQAFIKKFDKQLSEVLLKYNIGQNYVREYNIIQYLKNNICKINIPLNIIRYYPIILQ